MINFPKDKNKKVSAVIAAAGNSIRMNGTKSKQFIEINGRPAIAYTLEAFEKSRYTDEIIIVTRENDILFMSDIVKSFGISKVTDIVTGGNSRTESVKNGLMHAKGEIVAIHDGARICITPELIDKVIKTASETKAAALGCRLTDTLKLVDENNTIKKTIDRTNIWQIQTPQVFYKELILKAYEQINNDEATDDCMLLENIGVKITVVEGNRRNIKITVKDDINIAKAILEGEY